MKINGLILAAGLSSRMGAFKPLLRIDDKALITHSVESLFRGGAETVTVVLGYRAVEVQRLLEGRFSKGQVRFAFNHAYDTTDMLASVKLGISMLPHCDAFFLLPGDMPAVEEHTFSALAKALASTNALVAMPTINGYRKHPPLIRTSCINDILTFEGTGGLRELWSRYAGRIVEVPVHDKGCLLDADRMDDFLKLSRYLERNQRMSHTEIEPTIPMIG
ncbi:MAG: nucleotidyltransferase family protein [Sphaerochaetaceae bacterium]